MRERGRPGPGMADEVLRRVIQINALPDVRGALYSQEIVNCKGCQRFFYAVFPEEGRSLLHQALNRRFKSCDPQAKLGHPIAEDVIFSLEELRARPANGYHKSKTGT